MNILELKEELLKLDNEDLNYIVFELLIKNKMDFVELSKLYVNYLTVKDKFSTKKESLMARF